MDILLAHNYYQQPGGEDEVFEAESRLLESHGHRVVRFTVHNDDVGRLSRPALAAATVWNRRTYARLRSLVRAERPEVVHFHNTFPLISPAGYAAARAGGCAVVQTLHNYRLLCPNALFFREGGPCEACLGQTVAWPGVRHGCYRGSRAASAVVAGMLAAHRVAGTYQRMVDAYLVPSEFTREKYLRGGFPAAKVHVKPHFVAPDPGPGDGAGGFAVFVGRFSAGKGLETLLAAWPLLSRRVPLKIIGDGDLAPLVREAVAGCPEIEWLGRLPPAEVLRVVGDAAFLALTSECYETFGRVVIEAFARGTPVVAPDRGAAAELVDRTGAGVLFRSGDPGDLARAVDRMGSEPGSLAGMRRRAREEFDARYTGAANVGALVAVYERAVAVAGGRVGVTS